MPLGGSPLFIYDGGVFDPATLSLTGWWRASYTGAPWAPTASAGSSGANGDLVIGTAPANGTAQNSLTPADFNGTTHDLVNANDCLTTFGSFAAGTCWIVFLADSSVASVGAGVRVEDTGIVVQDTGATGWGITHSDDGVCALLYDGAYQEVVVAASNGDYHMAFVRWDSTLIELGVDSGAMSTLAAGAVDGGSAGGLAVGRNYSAAFFDGRILEVGFTDTALTDADRVNIRSYVNSRYALAL